MFGFPQTEGAASACFWLTDWFTFCVDQNNNDLNFTLLIETVVGQKEEEKEEKEEKVFTIFD